MTTEGDHDPNAMLRNIIESVCTGGEFVRGGQTVDNVAHILAAIAAQVNHNILSQHCESEIHSDAQAEETREPDSSDAEGDDPAASPSTVTQEANERETSEHSLINPQDTPPAEVVPQFYTVTAEDSGTSRTEEVLTSDKPKPICVKFPLEVRRTIINMRKEGKKSKDIAKELKVSVSGVQKVWERFLATGMIHDRKPSTYAGRPRKYIYSQDASGFDTQFLGDGNVEDFQSSGSQVEYIATHSDTPLPEGPTHAVVISTSDSELFTEEPMDAPGAMVEIVETPAANTPGRSLKNKKGTPAYREQLLLKLIEDCPLATLREAATQDGASASTNAHLQNLAVSVNRPLYLEYTLGHPFGKVPSPKPFDGNSEEAQVILSDPANPVGKDVLCALGYSSKVYFNACCTPSPLFDPQKVLTSLPISIGPGHLAETMRAILQLLLDLCQDPVAVLARIPSGPGPTLVARTLNGQEASHGFPPPVKLSTYWTDLYMYGSLLECCENFLSAAPPSAPCLLCHPFESFAQKLEIKDLYEGELSPTTPLSSFALSTPPTTSSHIGTPTISQASQVLGDSVESVGDVEVEVLQSGLVPQLPQRKGRGRPRKLAGSGARSPARRKGRGREEQEKVVSDGQFDMPISATEVLGRESAVEGDPPVVFTASPAVPRPESVSVSDQAITQPSVQESRRTPSSSQSSLSSHQVSLSPSIIMPVTTVLLGSVAESAAQVQAVDLTKISPRQQCDRQTSHDPEAPVVLTASWNQPKSPGKREDAKPSGGNNSQQKGRGKQRKRTVPTKRTTAKQSSNDVSPSETLTDPAVQADTSVRRSSRKRSVNSESEITPVSSSPAKRTRLTDAGREGTDGGQREPASWGVEEVAEFIATIPHCTYYTQVFKENEVDGETLLSMDPEMMVKLMGVKAGPALRIYKRVISLKGQSASQS